MVSGEFGPGADDVDVGFGADPGEAGAVAGEGRGEVSDVDAEEAAGESVDVDVGNAEGVGIGFSVIRLLGFIVIVETPMRNSVRSVGVMVRL